MIRKLSSALIKPLLITYKIDFYWKTSNVRTANSSKWGVMIRLLHYFYTIKALTGSLLSEIKLSKANKKQRHWLNIYQWLKEIAKWIPLSLVQNETHTEFTNSINGFTLIAAEVTLKWRQGLMQLPLHYPIQQTQLQTHS